MAYVNENIIVGAADVFIGKEEGVTETPALVPTESARTTLQTTLKDGWRHVGLTQGGVEFSYAPDFGEVDVDQYLDVAKMFKQRQSVTVNTTFVEATLENLLFAWGQPVDTLVPEERTTGFEDAVLTIHGGALGDKPVERSVVFVGQAPAAPGTDRERVYYLARALNVEASSHSLSKTEATVIPAALRCLPVGDLAGTVSYGSIIERTVTAGP